MTQFLNVSWLILFLFKYNRHWISVNSSKLSCASSFVRKNRRTEVCRAKFKKNNFCLHRVLCNSTKIILKFKLNRTYLTIYLSFSLSISFSKLSKKRTKLVSSISTWNYFSTNHILLKTPTRFNTPLNS